MSNDIQILKKTTAQMFSNVFYSSTLLFIKITNKTWCELNLLQFSDCMLPSSKSRTCDLNIYSGR